jgi:NADPH2:quinone reductase
MGTCSGACAESVVMDSRLAIKVPESLNWHQAAAIPVAYMTEHNALVTNGHLEIGESVLINAASSGAAVAGIQIARLTDGKGVNLIIDHVGGPFLDGNLRCMALKGRLVSVGRIEPVIDRIFPLEEAVAARDYLVSNSQTGEVVLTSG